MKVHTRLETVRSPAFHHLYTSGLISAGLFIFLSFSCLSAKKVTVEGVGYDEKAALQNALRHAVEEGAAEYLKDEGVAENRDKLNTKILKQSGGYVKNHFVISTEKEFGLVKVKVAAEVEMGKLEEDLIAQKLLYEIKNKPRVMIIIDERAEGQEMFEKTATHKFEEYLLEKEFKIIEPEQFKKVQELEKAKAMTDEDLAVLGFRLGADLIIRGGVSVGKPTPKKIYGKDFFTVPVQLNAHLVRADNAEIIASKTKRVKKNSQEEFSAAQFGLEVGGEALAKELINSLMQYWRSEAYNQATAELIVSGLDNAGIANLNRKLREVPFIKDVNLRYFETKSALFDLTIKGTVQDLRDLFTTNQDLGLMVTHLTANRIGTKAGKGATGASQISYEMVSGPSLDIENFSIKEIFPSRVRYYEQNPLASVTLKAGSGGSVQNIKVSVKIPEIMDLPSETVYKQMGPGEKAEVELKLILNSDKVLKIGETKTVNGQVTLSYTENGKQQTRDLTTPVTVYDRNSMDWEDPNSVAAFVTYREPSVNGFARQAVSAIKDKEGLNTALVNGTAIFEALTKLGIKYVKDPAGAPGNRVLDRVQYPFETMVSGTGDCDDTSVLFAALLTAVGIKGAIVSYPDHVLVMFDTEIFEKNRFALGADANRAISHRGTLWIPVETTLINKGFLEAWTTAAGEFQQAVSDGQRVSLIELDEAWKTFAAASPSNPQKEWQTAGLDKAVASAQKAIHDDAAASWKKAIGEIESKKDRTDKDANLLGIFYARSGDYKKAEEIFKDLSKKASTPELMSNYACAVILGGDEKRALEILDKAYKGNQLPGMAVNRALSYYLKSQSDNDVEGFVTALREAKNLLPAGANLDKYLGMDLGSNENTRAAGEHENAVPQKIDKRRLQELIKQRVMSIDVKSKDQAPEKGKAKIMHFGGVRGADPEQVSQIVDLLYWFEI